jgi:hypothetical protein
MRIALNHVNPVHETLSGVQRNLSDLRTALIGAPTAGRLAWPG